MSQTPDLQQDREQAIDWLLKLRDPACTDAERRNFAVWLAAREERHVLYERLSAHWDSLDRFKGMDFPIASAARRYHARRRRSRLPALAMAASVLLALGLTAFSPEGWYGESMTYATAHGQRQSLALADGSTLELNSDTQVSVHYNRWRRSVRLHQGEVYFQVIHNADRPFQVAAGDGRCLDIGTAFDIYRQREKVTIVVAEGRVRVEAQGIRELGAGQSIAYAPGGRFVTVTQSAAVEDLTAWRRGELVFENRRLDDVLAEVARYQNQRLTLGDASLASLRVSGSFHLDRLDRALETIALTLPISIQHPNPGETVLRRR